MVKTREMTKNSEEKDTSNLNSGAKNKRTEAPGNATGKASAKSPLTTPLGQPAGQPSMPAESENNDTSLCDTSLCDDLQARIHNALMSEKVIGTIVKAVADAILENVTAKVYEAIDFDIQAKTAQILKLEQEIVTMRKEIRFFRRAAEEQEQYSRRNCLRVHGIDETSEEVTDQIIINLVKEKMNIDLRPDDLDRSHRVPVRSYQRAGEQRSPAKPIIVKFSLYNVRREIYAARSKLKGTRIYIHEDLTRERSDLLFKTRNLGNVARTWTYDGRIFALTKDNRKVKITKEADLERIGDDITKFPYSDANYLKWDQNILV